MKLVKRNNGRRILPSFKDWAEDFWDTDNFFDLEFSPFRSSWKPAVNIKDNDKDFAIDVAAPGLSKEDFKVKVENGMLSISAEKEESKEEKDENYTRQEFSYNSFERTFTLPDYVDPESIVAKYKDGVLNLNLKKIKQNEQKAKEIKIA